MEDNNKRILKNTIYLYIRQFVIMALAFISTRIVLNKLGVDDYGIYNVVGGFVALFTILNNVLQSATRRFMALAIGERIDKKVKYTFSTSIVLHIVIGVIVVFLLESLGLWFLNYKLNIPLERLNAANWVFQFSVISVFVSIMQTPFSAAVTAHEHFNIYAIMSIYDAVAKIVLLFLLVYIPGDKLIVYAALMMIVTVTGTIFYQIYCRQRFRECRISVAIDKDLMKEMLKFSGWDSFGNVTSILNGQGISILLNMFFNVAVNAARGIANSVTSTVSQFVFGFIAAAEPQLVKYHAQGDKKAFEKLIFNISQVTLFMLAIIAVPIFLEIDFVLKLWLGTVPQYTPEFIKITILCSFIQYSNSMILKGNVAIGRVKQISLFMAPIGILHLPLVWVVLRLGCPPTAVYWVSMIPGLSRFVIDLSILKKYADFPSEYYFVNIFAKNMAILAAACIIPYLVQCQMGDGWIRFFIVSSVSVLSTVMFMYLLGLNKDTRMMVRQKVLGRFIKSFR